MKNIIYNIIISLFITISIKYLGNISSIGFIDVVLFPIIYSYISKVKNGIKKDKLTIIFSTVLSFIIIIGKEICLNHNLNSINNNIIKYIIIILGTILLSDLLLMIFVNLMDRIKKINLNITISKRTVIISFLFLIIIYFFVYFSFYPGIYYHDMNYIIKMANGSCELSNHHPIIYVMLWRLLLFIEQSNNINNIGVIIYSVFQIFVVFTTCFYLLHWEYKNKFDNKYIIFTYVYFLINPILHIYSFITTKDTFFACSLLLFLTALIDIKKINNKAIIKLFIFSFLTCLLRNNFVYIIVAIIPFILILQADKRIIIPLVFSSILFFALIYVIFPFFNIKKSSISEMIPIPIIQIHYTYKNTNVYSEEEKNILREIMPHIDEKFSRRTVDPIKNKFNDNAYKKYKKEFWRIYLKGINNDKKEYLYLALDLNSRYWYYDNEIIDYDNGKEFIMDKLYDEEKHNNIPGLFQIIYKQYKVIDSGKASFMNKPIIKFFFTVSFNTYMLIFLLYYSIKNRKKYSSLVIIELLLLIGTYLLGPLTDFRYVFPLYFCLPFYIITTIDEKNNS